MDTWRYLQDEAATTAPSLSPTTEAEAIEGKDSEVLRNTLRIYGTLFAIMALIFSYVRRKYPNVYNLRGYVEDLKTHLADDQFGFLSWLWKLYFVSDSEFLEECGMDSLCFVRVLEFGFKLSVVGIVNAIWLMPIYATSESTEETRDVTDPIQKVSVANVPSESFRFLATVISAYIIFGFTMYNILKEFEWFILQRHTFLAKPYARNYAVYIQNIPHEYLSNAKLTEFFRQASAQDSLREVQLARKIPNLSKNVTKREALVAQLEHAINVEEVTGETPMTMTLLGERRNAITAHYEELNELNKEITTSIEKIELLQDGVTKEQIETLSPSDASVGASLLGSVQPGSIKPGTEVNIPESPAASAVPSEIGVRGAESIAEEQPLDSSTKKNLFMQGPNMLTKNLKSVSHNITSAIPTDQLKGVAGAAGGAMMGMLAGEEDGAPFNSAFVTFNSLQAAQASLQMLQYPEPFAMEVLEAPEPDDIFWQNVGRTHKELQLGQLFSFGLTSALCLFWTIPMITINTLSSIEGLRDVKHVGDFIDNNPWLVPIVTQLAPLLIVVAKIVLKIILERLSMLEGPISGSVVQASLFVKLAAFMLIQTFFVSAISGGLVSELSKMLEEPNLIVETLAQSLPGQSTFHTQILLVDTFLPLGLELLRVVPLAIAGVRRLVGPNLTEKERNTPFLGLSPITCPEEFGHADVLSGSVLYFMVFFVYSTIAPITCFFMGFCFLLMGACYRHQIIYVYPTVPDSGGKLWVKFISLLPMMMIMSQVILLGLLSLKLAFTSSTLMIPLIIITVLFNMYIRQMHFKMTEHLPCRIAIRQDLKNVSNNMDFTFLDGLYVQPELRDKEILPENSTVDREITIENGAFFGTPQNSVVDESEEHREDKDELASFAYTPSTINA